MERNRLRSRVGVVSVVEDNLVRFNITTRIHDPGLYTVRLQVFKRKQEVISLSLLLIFLYTLKQDKNNKGLSAWKWRTLNCGRLPGFTYTGLSAQLIDANGYVAAIETYFGLRKIEARGKYIYLNNTSIYLDGILYQPAISSYEQIKQHMLAMKALGCNLVRIHIAGVDPRVYNLADTLGLLLWVEVPSPHRSSLKSRENHRAELLRMLDLIGSHPSVVI